MEGGPLPAHGAPSGGDHSVVTLKTQYRRLLRVQKGLHAPVVQQLL